MRERYEVEDITCDNCHKKKLTRKEHIFLHTSEDEFDLCSIECLNEYSWKLRESRPKLSKSKVVETIWEDPSK